MFEIVVGIFSIIGVLIAIISLFRSTHNSKEVERIKTEIEQINIKFTQTNYSGGNINAGGYIKAGGSITTNSGKINKELKP